MLEIQNADAIIIVGHKYLDTEEGRTRQAVVKMSLAVMDNTDAILGALRVPSLRHALWLPNGEPLLQEGSFTLKHKVENCTVTLTQGSCETKLIGDLSSFKLVSLPARGLEIRCKLNAQAGIDDMAVLLAQEEDGVCDCHIQENQMDLHSVAA